VTITGGEIHPQDGCAALRAEVAAGESLNMGRCIGGIRWR
jgi:hypothetical protein